jgi:hypothetical protein
MKSLFHFPAEYYCLTSLVGVGGAYLGWKLWFISGGWERHQHWGDSILWSTSAVAGLLAAIAAIRIGRGSLLVKAASLVLGTFHVLSLILFLIFMDLLSHGGPR